MGYRIESIQLFLRETKPARFPTALGNAALTMQKPEHATSPLCHVRLLLANDAGDLAFGCAADRLSVRWLDKRAGKTESKKLQELGALLETARKIYLAASRFETPFEQWKVCHPRIMKAGQVSQQEDLTATFASALMERAMLDAVCRLEGQSLFTMIRDERLGIRPQEIHPELTGFEVGRLLPAMPVTTINIRHTVGIFDPLTDEDWPAESRINDGLPETLKDYIDVQGIRYFKVKISGDIEADVQRLGRLWEILPLDNQPEITLDANEAFMDMEQFAVFVRRLEREHLGLFQHILYIEQPLTRELSLAPKAEKWIRELSESKPIIIDESDSTVDACRQAMQMGYAGTSHKNCKGILKSLLNLAFLSRLAGDGRLTVLSAEDLQNLPVVPVQQDFVSVGILGLDHCERNGHHYNFGLSMLSDKEKEQCTRRHPDLYEKRGDEWFLHIENGTVQCASLHGPGFGVVDEPDWDSMENLHHWLARRHPV